MFDVRSPQLATAPWPTYARMREEAPVHRLAGMPGVFAICRYEDVRAVLSDAETFSSSLERDAEPMLMVFRDGESHDRLRRVMSAAFTPRAIEAMTPAMEKTAADSLQEVLDRGRGDLVGEWCRPIPMAAIVEILGVPTDLASEFQRWARDLLVVFFASPMAGESAASHWERLRALAPVGFSLLSALGPRLGVQLFQTIRRAASQRGTIWTAQRLRSARGMAEFLVFFGRVLQDQRRLPRDNVLDMLIRAQSAEVPGGARARVSDVELLMQGLALMTAGIDTTAMLLSSGVRALCDRPALYAALRADSGQVDAFVHEVLRLWSPVQWTHRRATRDIRLHGTEIPRDSLVYALVGSANRDPARFAAPDELRLDRDDTGYLSFAIGRHVCIGRNLALFQARVAFRQLLRLVASIRLDPAGSPGFSRAGGTHGFESLPVILEPA